MKYYLFRYRIWVQSTVCEKAKRENCYWAAVCFRNNISEIMCERKTAITDTKKWGGHLAERIPLLNTGMKHYSLQHTLTVSLFYMMIFLTFNDFMRRNVKSTLRRLTTLFFLHIRLLVLYCYCTWSPILFFESTIVLVILIQQQQSLGTT